MPIYELTNDKFKAVPETTYAAAEIKERSDLQRILKGQIEIVSPETLLIAEEFNKWDESRRSIDLLGIDKDANLVVIELKRTEDGGHSELQAIRYAAMISTMTFDQALDHYQAFLRKNGIDKDALESILEFLEWDERDEDQFAQDTRIVLVSAEFSKELTTAVMWLNQREMDIRCVRAKPHSDGDRILVDVQQVIPLPEAKDYLVGIKQKGLEVRKEKQQRAEHRNSRGEFWDALVEFANLKTDRFVDIADTKGAYRRVPTGIAGFRYVFIVWKDATGIELFIDRRELTSNSFDYLISHKSKIELEFGTELEWDDNAGQNKARIRKVYHSGGFKSERDQWQNVIEEVVNGMIKFESAMSPYLDEFRK